MSLRYVLACSLAANLVFWPALFVFAALRPEYSHLTKAVSELGSVDAPRKLAWNLIGFIVPGALIAIAGWGLGRKVARRGWLLPGLLSLGGAMIVVAGLAPADLDNWQGLQTVVHLIGANGSLLAWLLALVGLIFKIRGPWKGLAYTAIACLAASVAAVLAAGGYSPALVQRLLIGIFYGSYVLLALLALRPASRGSA